MAKNIEIRVKELKTSAQKMNTDTNSEQTDITKCPKYANMLSTMMSARQSTKQKNDTLNKFKRSSETTGLI